MRKLAARLSFIQSFQKLTGNIRVSVIFEIPFSIASAFYSFYLSLYMRECGLGDAQIGVVVSVGFLSGIVFAFLAPSIINRLGRRTSTLVFELTAYPASCLLYCIASSFPLFLLAQVVASAKQISTVAWNFMVLEDADDEQRTAAFNLLTVMHTATGVITPLLGLLVGRLGIIRAQRGLLLLAAAIMIVEMIIRHHYYTETRVGLRLMQRERGPRERWFGGVLEALRSIPDMLRHREIFKAVAMNVLYNMMYPLTTHYSFYLNLYLTGRGGIDEASVSLVGGFNAVGIILGGLVLVTLLNRLIRSGRGMCGACGLGFAIQIPFVIIMMLIPKGNLLLCCVAVFIYALGFSVTKTYLDSLLANVTEQIPERRSNLYAINNVLISLTGMGSTALAGVLFVVQPESLFVLSLLILLLALGVAFSLYRGMKKRADEGAAQEGKAVSNA